MSESMCPNWVSVTNANAHVAKDKGWFSNYTEFESELTGSGNESLQMLGVGTVHLKLETAPGGEEHTLELHDVLHVPKSICNMVQLNLVEPPLKVTYGTSNGQDKGSVDDQNGQQIGYFDLNEELYQLKLSGASMGPSTMPAGQAYVVGNRRSAAEKKRWASFKGKA